MSGSEIRPLAGQTFLIKGRLGQLCQVAAEKQVPLYLLESDAQTLLGYEYGRDFLLFLRQLIPVQILSVADVSPIPSVSKISLRKNAITAPWFQEIRTAAVISGADVVFPFLPISYSEKMMNFISFIEKNESNKKNSQSFSQVLFDISIPYTLLNII